MQRPTDEAWEALVRETLAHPDLERGQLNTALRAIRKAAAEEGIEDVPGEIRRRADGYRATFPNCSLTPIALAKHWYRVVAPPVSSVTATLDRLRAVS